MIWSRSPMKSDDTPMMSDDVAFFDKYARYAVAISRFRIVGLKKSIGFGNLSQRVQSDIDAALHLKSAVCRARGQAHRRQRNHRSGPRPPPFCVPTG